MAQPTLLQDPVRKGPVAVACIHCTFFFLNKILRGVMSLITNTDEMLADFTIILGKASNIEIVANYLATYNFNVKVKRTDSRELSTLSNKGVL